MLLERLLRVYKQIRHPRFDASHDALIAEVDEALASPEVALLHTVAEKGLLSPETVWIQNHRLVGRHQLVNGALAEVLPLCPDQFLPWVIRSYKEAIEDEYYTISFKNPSPEEKGLPLCPYSSFHMRPLKVDQKLISALELIYAAYYGWGHRDERMPTHMPHMYADLMVITWHLERSSHTGFVPFSQKWEEAKNWPVDRGIVGPQILSCFLTPRQQYISLLKITDFMSREERQRLYKDALEYYTSTIDRSYFGDHLTTPSKIGPMRLLFDSLMGTADWDDDFLEWFIATYNKPTRSDSDGEQVNQAGDP